MPSVVYCALSKSQFQPKCSFLPFDRVGNGQNFGQDVTIVFEAIGEIFSHFICGHGGTGIKKCAGTPVIPHWWNALTFYWNTGTGHEIKTPLQGANLGQIFIAVTDAHW